MTADRLLAATITPAPGHGRLDGLWLLPPDPGQLIPLAKGPGIAILVGGPVTALPVMAVFVSMFRKRALAVGVGGMPVLAFGEPYLPFQT